MFKVRIFPKTMENCYDRYNLKIEQRPKNPKSNRPIGLLIYTGQNTRKKIIGARLK